VKYTLVPVGMKLTSTEMSNIAIDIRVILPVMSMRKMSTSAIIMITILNSYAYIVNMTYLMLVINLPL